MVDNPAPEVPAEPQAPTVAKPSKMLVQAAGALAWGVFFSVIPIAEGLVLSSIVWLPLLVWRERVRAKAHGFWPGFGIRVLVIVLVVGSAIYLPVKHEDTKRIGPLPSSEISLADLSKHISLHGQIPDEKFKTVIRLPSANPTWREIVHSIKTQTDLVVSSPGCGTGACILTGGYPMGIFLSLETPSAGN